MLNGAKKCAAIPESMDDSQCAPEGKVGIEALLNEGCRVSIQPKGFSMYPLLVPGRDKVIIEGAGTDGLRRGDVVLYRRKNGLLVLHRIFKIDETGYYMVGDNQVQVEGPLEESQIKGRLAAFERKGRLIEADSLIYRFIGSLWLALRPVRPVISKGVHSVKKVIKGTEK